MATKAKAISKNMPEAKPGRRYEPRARRCRQRILEAAFAAFMERGFATTSTLEIATRARVSKRALYEEVGNKDEMLVACIAERARRLKIPADLLEDLAIAPR